MKLITCLLALTWFALSIEASELKGNGLVSIETNFGPQWKTNGLGSIIQDKGTGKLYLLTAAHVITGDKSTFQLSDYPNSPTIELNKNKNTLFDNLCDVAIVDITDKFSQDSRPYPFATFKESSLIITGKTKLDYYGDHKNSFIVNESYPLKAIRASSDRYSQGGQVEPGGFYFLQGGSFVVTPLQYPSKAVAYDDRYDKYFKVKNNPEYSINYDVNYVNHSQLEIGARPGMSGVPIIQRLNIQETDKFKILGLVRSYHPRKKISYRSNNQCLVNIIEKYKSGSRGILKNWRGQKITWAFTPARGTYRHFGKDFHESSSEQMTHNVSKTRSKKKVEDDIATKGKSGKFVVAGGGDASDVGNIISDNVQVINHRGNADIIDIRESGNPLPVSNFKIIKEGKSLNFYPDEFTLETLKDGKKFQYHTEYASNMPELFTQRFNSISTLANAEYRTEEQFFKVDIDANQESVKLTIIIESKDKKYKLNIDYLPNGKMNINGKVLKFSPWIAFINKEGDYYYFDFKNIFYHSLDTIDNNIKTFTDITNRTPRIVVSRVREDQIAESPFYLIFD